jgi:hypothetical protein
LGPPFGTLIWDPNLGPQFGTPIWNPNLGARFGSPIWEPYLGLQYGTPIWDPALTIAPDYYILGSQFWDELLQVELFYFGMNYSRVNYSILGPQLGMGPRCGNLNWAPDLGPQ